MSTGPHNNEFVLKNTAEQYSIVFSKTFGTNGDEEVVVKTDVPLTSIKRIQFAVTTDVTVELVLTGIDPLNNKTILQLANTGEFIFDAMSQSGPYIIDRTVYTGLLAISTHNVKEGAGYTIIVSGTK